MKDAPANQVVSEEYGQLQQAHQNPNYGVDSIQFAAVVKQLAEQLGAKSRSDEGAGKRFFVVVTPCPRDAV